MSLLRSVSSVAVGVSVSKSFSSQKPLSSVAPVISSPVRVSIAPLKSSTMPVSAMISSLACIWSSQPNILANSRGYIVLRMK